jgi:iron(III) transport system permease protein
LGNGSYKHLKYRTSLSTNLYQGKLSTLALFLCVLASIPIISIFTSFSDINLQNWQHLLDNVLGEYIANSLMLMLGVGCLSALIGGTLAWIVVRYDFWGRQACQWLLLLPLAMPAYIIAYAYTGMLDFAGPLQSYLRESFDWSASDYYFPEVRSMGGAITLMSI